MTQPTEQQLNDPTWWDENAPEWAKTIIRAKHDDDLWWFEHRVGRGIAMNLRSDQQMTADNAGFASAWRTVAVRPKPWNGEGLPPVGCECERQTGSGKWIKVIVLGYHDRFVWLSLEDRPDPVTFYVADSDFRPLRTPEQRERDELALTVWGCIGGGKARAYEIADEVIAAGWRKGAE